MRWTQEVYLLSPKLISKLRGSFNALGGFGEFEDFYHDYVIHILEGKGKHQTVDQFAIDRYREMVGWKGKKKQLAFAVSSDEYLANLEAEKSHLSMPYILHVKELLGKYTGMSRVIVALYYVYGYEQEEIGLLYGISASRISQMLKEIKEGRNFAERNSTTPTVDLQDENVKLQSENTRLKEKLVKVYRKNSKKRIF